MNNLLNLLSQNPQLQAIMSQFSTPEQAKQKVLEIFNSGNLTSQDIERLKVISKNFGIENEVNEALSQLDLSNIKKSRKNRW